MKNKLPKELIFAQGFGIYSDQMLVIAGVTDKQKVFRYLKKAKANAEFSKWILTDFDEYREKIAKENKALFCWNTEVNGVALILRQPEDTWEYWETLLHEIHHVTLYIAKKKCFLEELENQAYLFEFLFHNIRRKLQGVG